MASHARKLGTGGDAPINTALAKVVPPPAPSQQTFVEDASGRHDDDFYRTPGYVTSALCDELVRRGITPRTIVDAGCGDGAIGTVLKQRFPLTWLVGVEKDRGRLGRALDAHTGKQCAYDCVDEMDWFGVSSDDLRDWSRIGPRQTPADLIVSNPPFKHALAFLELARKRVLAGGYIAFLLKAQFDQETPEREAFFDELRHADGSEGYGLLRVKGRIPFRGGSSADTCTYHWVCIGPGFDGFFARVPRSPMGGTTQLSLL
jgi:hypothetical protein